VCALIAVILNIVAFDSSSPIDCQLWVIFELIFSYLAFVTASLMIVLRIIAIWDRNRIAVAIAIGAWSTNIAFLIHNIALVHATWAPTQGVCEVLDTGSSKKTIFAVLASDVVLLLTMLAGLLRLRLHGSTFGLGHFLWRQGLIWLFFATIAEVPPAVFIGLNLNYSFNLMFQTPALIVMTIAATRMHRSLSEFVHSGAVDTYSTRRGCQCIAKKGLKPIFTVPIPPNQVEEAVHKTPEDYSPGNIGQYGDLFSADNQSRYQLLMLNDLENQAVENGTKR